MFSMSVLTFSEREKNQILYLRRKVMVREIRGKKTLFPPSIPPSLPSFPTSLLPSFILLFLLFIYHLCVIDLYLSTYSLVLAI